MDTATALPRVDASTATTVLPRLNAAMARGEITTPRRAQYFLAALGHESVSLRYFEDLASGAAYEAGPTSATSILATGHVSRAAG